MRNLSIKLYHIYVCCTNITLYHVIYNVRYYPRLQVTAVGFGTITRRYGGPSVYENEGHCKFGDSDLH